MRIDGGLARRIRGCGTYGANWGRAAEPRVRIEGLGEVTRVLAGPTCDLLELEDGSLVPLVGDAVSRVDTAARVIEIDRRFLGR